MAILRILHCLETVGSGGVEQLKLLKARQLDKSRYEQALICTKAIGVLPAKFVSEGCPVHEIGVFRGIFDRARYIRALAIVRHFKPDIIHGAVYEGVAVATLVGRWTGVPVIIGEETSDPTNRRWTGNILYRGLASLTHQMVAVSPAVQDYLVNRIRLPQRKVTLINNGVANPGPTSVEQKRLLKQALGIKSDDFVIGSCGRLFDQYKRFSDLIQAFALVRKRIANAKLLIVGEGPDEAMLRNLAAQLGVTDGVLFAGYQGETRPYYDVMDIFALASANEAFGLVLVEAMYAKLPIVATRVGGIPSVVIDSKTGLLVEPKDPVALADRLLVLINSAELRTSMGQQGHERALAEFGAERYVREFDELYQRLAAHWLH
jgi:glycosyltransferase involved in cell wall biosynthesis